MGPATATAESNPGGDVQQGVVTSKRVAVTLDPSRMFRSKAADLFRQPCESDLQGDVQGVASEADLSGKVRCSKPGMFKAACLWQSS